jgi:hypothetical protein
MDREAERVSETVGMRNSGVIYESSKYRSFLCSSITLPVRSAGASPTVVLKVSRFLQNRDGVLGPSPSDDGESTICHIYVLYIQMFAFDSGSRACRSNTTFLLVTNWVSSCVLSLTPGGFHSVPFTTLYDVTFHIWWKTLFSTPALASSPWSNLGPDVR